MENIDATTAFTPRCKSRGVERGGANRATTSGVASPKIWGGGQKIGRGKNV